MLNLLTKEQLLGSVPIYCNTIGKVKSPFLKDLLPSYNPENWNNYMLLNMIVNSTNKQLYDFFTNMGLISVGTFNDLQLQDVTKYQLITCDETIRVLFMITIKLVLCDEINYSSDHSSFFITSTKEDKKVMVGALTENNFDMFLKIISQLFHQEDASNGNSTAGKGTDIAEQWWKEAEKYEKEIAKQDNTNNTDFAISNIISKVCSLGIGYTFFNVFDLTLYQLIEIISNYCNFRYSNLNDRIFSIHGGDEHDALAWLHEK